VDLDGDGRNDILSGSYSRMGGSMAGLFQVLWGQGNGKFKTAAPVTGTDGKPLIIPVEGDEQDTNNLIKKICTRPFAVDWDGDGNLDLVVGNFAGTFYLFKGQGKGKFLPKPEEIKARNEPLKNDGYHGDPFVVDWDGDGDLDILSGSSAGGVNWAENRAGPGKAPQLAPFRPLIKHGAETPYGAIVREGDLKGPQTCTRVWVDDWNSDGKLDLLVGDLTTLISPADGVAESEFQEKLAQWTKASNEAAAQLNAAGNDPKKQSEAQERGQKLYMERTGFIKEDRTGFVWLYLRK
jgi:hypothetical protein